MTATTPRATTTSAIPASTRARSDSRITIVSSSPAPDGVADAADRGDQLRLGGVELAAEVADVRLDDAAVAAEVVLPDVIEDLRLGQHPALVDEQVAEQVVLRRRQRDLDAAPRDLVGVVVHLEVAARNTVRSLAALPGAPQHGRRAGHQLLEAERLLEVVVAAEREPAHLVLGGVAGGEEQHRRVVAAGPQPPADLEPVEVGQHHVEQDEVGRQLADGVERRAPVAAADTSKPWWRSAAASIERRFSSSSTISRCSPAMCPVSPACLGVRCEPG